MIQKNIIFIIEINKFRGDLTDTRAETKTLSGEHIREPATHQQNMMSQRSKYIDADHDQWWSYGRNIG